MTLSLRDPAGRIVIAGGRVLRVVTDAAAAETVRAVLDLAPVRAAMDDGRLVRSWVVGGDQASGLLEGLEAGSSSAAPVLVLEHERVAFPSYPYEWPPEMLAAAGRLTLNLALELLPLGYGLKDATPYNVLFRGPSPVFVDILSIERREPRDPTWRPYAQFVRTFLAPLAAHRACGLPLSGLFLTRRDGLEPEELYQLCGPLRRLRPPFLGLATLPTWLARLSRPRPGLYAPRLLGDPERARFVLASLLRGLRRRLDRLGAGDSRGSSWSGYESSGHYSAGDRERKEKFVAAAIADHAVTAVLDLGCNTGRFSRLAAQGGADVVAVDGDAAVVGAAWRQARAEALGVLPLVVDVARPSPAAGWRGREHLAFLDRARNGFDLVLLLALVHHLTVGDGVPLGEVALLAADLTRHLAVVEHVEPADPQFRTIARGRDALFAGLDRAAFEAAFSAHFQVLRREPLADAPRQLYLLRRRQPGSS